MGFNGEKYLPDWFILETRLKGSGFLQVCRLCLQKVAAVGLPPVAKWEIPFDAPARSDSLTKYLDSLSEQEASKIVNGQIYLKDETLLNVFRDQDTWVCELYLNVDEANVAQIPSHLKTAAAFCQSLLNKECLLDASLERVGGGADCIPEPPVAGRKTHLVITTREEVDTKYDHPDVFWQAGWTTVQQHGNRYLLLRAMQAEDNVAFLSAVLPHQWAMARAAKAGLTKYYTPVLEPEEMDIYKSGRQYLEVVGYLPDERLVEFSCYIPPNEHIAGWEIYEIAHLIWEGNLQDGRAVDAVRIVFYEREMAEREKRPLLDVGAKVFYEDSSGELVEITQ